MYTSLPLFYPVAVRGHVSQFLVWGLACHSLHSIAAHHRVRRVRLILMIAIISLLIYICSHAPEVFAHPVLCLDFLVVGGANWAATVHRMRLRTVEAALIDSRAAVSSDWHAAVVCFVNSIDLSDFVIDLLIHVLLLVCLQRVAAVSDVARVVREV